MKILRVIATLDPRHGGPAAGLRAITPALAALGHETTFASMDAPARAEIFQKQMGAAVIGLGPAYGGYAYTRKLEPWLRAHARQYDAIFVHGLWQYHGRAVRNVLRDQRLPYFVFPHGMLDPWFRRAYPLKHAKKWTYWQLFERHVLRHAAAVFFTCDEERRLARQTFHPYRCNERVVAYGTAAPVGDPDQHAALWRTSMPEIGSQPYWLFLGRIHPKKGVDLLLRAYSALAAEATDKLPVLVIAGPCDDPAYRRTLEQLAGTIAPPGQICWTGMLEGTRKTGALRSAEAFVLPSHQENFGIAVAEALSVGTPVLISRKVNIWREIEAAGAGYVGTDDDAGVTRLLRAWSTASSSQRRQMSERAAALFQERYEIGRVARSLVNAVTPFVTSVHPPHEAHKDHPIFSRVG